MAGEAGTGSTFLFDYAGHGTRSGAGCCFANYDMRDASNGLLTEAGIDGGCVASVVPDSTSAASKPDSGSCRSSRRAQKAARC